MGVFTIITLSLLCLYLVLIIINENRKQKWYRRGYVDACHRYDERGDYREITYEDEADSEFSVRYGGYTETE
jgi:hypothetical protein